MARITIVHTTNYRYRNPVGLTRHRMMLRPDDSHDLRLHDATLAIDPSPVSTRWAHDVFNNSICLVEWPPSLRTEHLTIVSTLDLTHYPGGPALPDYTLDPSAEVLPFSYPEQEVPDLSNLARPQLPDPDGSVAAWARRFIPEPGKTATLKMLAAMTHAIRRSPHLRCARGNRHLGPDEDPAAGERQLSRLCRLDDGGGALVGARRAFRQRLSLCPRG